MTELSEKYAFISYSTKNQSLADTMRNLLNRHGIRTWMAPNDIPYGSKYAQVINQAIKGCACFVLILSNSAQNSVWVAKEVERAINYRKPIFPVQIEPLVLNDEFELYISTDQIVAISKLNENSEEIRRLIDIIGNVTETNTKKTTTSAPKPSTGRPITASRPAPVTQSRPSQATDASSHSFYLPVEDTFVITGRGVAVVGGIQKGVIRLNDIVTMLFRDGSTSFTTVTGIEMFKKILDYATEGDNVGILLRGVPKERRNDIVAIFK